MGTKTDDMQFVLYGGFTQSHALQERQLKEAQAASRDRAEAVAAEMDAMRENALAAALAEARHSLAALQRQHEAGQRSLAELQVPHYNFNSHAACKCLRYGHMEHAESH